MAARPRSVPVGNRRVRSLRPAPDGRSASPQTPRRRSPVPAARPAIGGEWNASGFLRHHITQATDVADEVGSELFAQRMDIDLDRVTAEFFSPPPTHFFYFYFYV